MPAPEKQAKACARSLTNGLLFGQPLKSLFFDGEVELNSECIPRSLLRG